MPTIEFHGFSEGELSQLTTGVSHAVMDNPFADQIVLMYGNGHVVTDLQGRHRPFLRILTRSAERADVLRGQLEHLADIEIVFIQFYERNA